MEAQERYWPWGRWEARTSGPRGLALPECDSPHPLRYPSVACEILTSDVPQINDALGADESLLNRLYGFLQSSGSLNPLLASFFSKVMGILINRKTDQVPTAPGPAGVGSVVGVLPSDSCVPQLVSFLRKKDDFVDLLLRHIGTSAVMDLLLRLLTCVERPQLRQDVVNVSTGRRLGVGALGGCGPPTSRLVVLAPVAQRGEDCPAAHRADPSIKR